MPGRVVGSCAGYVLWAGAESEPLNLRVPLLPDRGDGFGDLGFLGRQRYLPDRGVLPELLLCPSNIHLDGDGSAELGGSRRLRDYGADGEPALHARTGPGTSGGAAAGGGPEAVRAEPPHSAAGPATDDRAADRLADSRDLRDGIGGPVRRQVGSRGCERFAGRRSGTTGAQG